MTDETLYTKEDVKTTLKAVVETVEKFLDADLSKSTTDEPEEVKIFEAMDHLLTEVMEKMAHSDLEDDSTEYIEYLRDRAIKTAECLEILRPKIVNFFAALERFYRNGLKNQEFKQSN